MISFSMQFVGDSPGLSRTERVSAASCETARRIALGRLEHSQTFKAARIYEGDALVSVLGKPDRSDRSW